LHVYLNMHTNKPSKIIETGAGKHAYMKHPIRSALMEIRFFILASFAEEDKISTCYYFKIHYGENQID